MDIEATRGTLIPPQPFIETARSIARTLSLDAEMVISGCPMRHAGVEFWLQHYGQADPDGMVVMVEIGRVPRASEPSVLRALMEYQYIAPAAACGYCALVPGTNLLTYCVRIDFGRNADAAAEILELVARIPGIREDFFALLAAHDAPFDRAAEAADEREVDLIG